MLPSFFKIGPFEFHAYGFTLAVSFLVGMQLAVSEARRRGLPEQKVANLALWIMAMSVAGARILYVATHLPSYSGRWLEAFKLWEGGLTLYGGLLAAFATTWVLARRWGLGIGHTFDSFTPALALGEGITRIGCFLNGCCFGRPCTLPWAVTFPPDSHPGTVFPRTGLHPTQLYLSAAGFLTFALVWWLRRRIVTPGRLFFVFLLVECTSRFVIDFYRYYRPDGESVSVLGVQLSLTQVLCVVLAALAILGMFRGGRAARAAAV